MGILGYEFIVLLLLLLLDAGGGWLSGGRFSCGVPMEAVQRTTQRLHWGCTIIIRTMQRGAIINSFGGW